MKIYHAFKKATDGSNERWGFVPSLTHEEACDSARFPFGAHREADGRGYIWSFALMPEHVGQERDAIRALGRTSVPVPSAATAIVNRMGARRK